MRIYKISKKSCVILLTTFFLVIAFSSTGRANDANFALREVFTKSQSEPGEAFYFFIPQKEDGKNQNTYVYDTKLDRLLLLPESKDLISKLEDQGIDPEDWHVFLNEFILDGEASNRLKIIELDDNWVKFTLDGRHIVLPREHMVKDWGQKNFPLGKEIVNKNAALPQDYEPDDLVKIQQKWNFHAPDYPKYLRRYVARVIEQMLQNAEEQGVHIRVFSAYRSYEKQRYLFLNAVSCHGESQDRVAKQGHSEHQLGTTVDLCGLDPETVLSLNFDHTQEGRWLMENAHKFGFFQSYTKENQRLTGYMPEPWHYRFYGEKRN